MIAKTVTGNDFSGALEYGAGLRSDRTNKQAELLSVANVGSVDAPGIAAEMRAVAALSDRIRKPVWHTVLSWAPEEQVSREQKIQAAALYCELMGASLERHQVAVYEHKDKDHPHIHIYLNRVPIDGGAALRSDQNFARNVVATRQIREQLGMAPLPARRVSTKDLGPEREAARGYVREQLTAAMQDASVRTLAGLLDRLHQRQISTYLKRDAKGVLVGTSFEYAGQRVKGTEVGVRAKELRSHFAPFGREALRTPEHSNPVARQDSAALLTLTDQYAEVPAPATDDAQVNENRLKKRRRRPKL
ncbi:relaxase/mobilization nuclease domain-containing protein (plasmid) [Hymenobacter sp. NBH84]|uniref:relaxase/mobilization nuclease domain-containing protein n=1 Tax=Hymenobacter sp. NBH84 TaxID=2596915 RepID=UPI00162457B3|nr:relaxase/mobilization nuclease domain-containing protein [Hymenobacter sp. NBH84]QNE42178.1 relaxase/mobilization nuclease domain-containing protein [Hymenobacter sp. NBH84]